MNHNLDALPQRLPLLSPPLPPKHDLHDEVPGHAEAEHGEEDEELDADADGVAVGEGHDETDTLPKTVVGERGLLILDEEGPVKR